MKVVLLQDIKKLGKKHDTANVPDGYALNFLIPQKKAIAASDPKAKEVLAQAKSKQQAKAGQAARLKESISGKIISITSPANEEGQLYGSIVEKQILKAAKDQLNIELPLKDIILDEHIKHTGTFEVKIKLDKEEVEFTVSVQKS